MAVLWGQNASRFAIGHIISQACFNVKRHILTFVLASPRRKLPFGFLATKPRPQSICVPNTPTPVPSSSAPMTTETPPPTKASLKAWLNHFTFAQKMKKVAEEQRGEFFYIYLCIAPAVNNFLVPVEEGEHTVFGKPLRESLQYASVQISTANSNGELYVWGYIPVVVAKWCACLIASFVSSIDERFIVSGLYLKENGACLFGCDSLYIAHRKAATEVAGTFRVSGSNKRMRDLQALFETPPRVRTH